MTLYDEIVGTYAATRAGETARERARTMRADPAVAKKIEALQQAKLQQAAAKECGNWLTMSRSLAVKRIFTPGAPMKEIVEFVKTSVRRERRDEALM